MIGLTFVLTLAAARNESLATVVLEAGDVEDQSTYCQEWTRWNHVRGATALVTAGLMVLGLSKGSF